MPPVVEITCVATNKTVRIQNSKVDASGGHGPFAKFQLIKSGDKMKIQSNNKSSEFIALDSSSGRVYVSNQNDKNCVFKAIEHIGENGLISLRAYDSDFSYLGFNASGQPVKCNNAFDAAQKSSTRFKITKC